jgi:hypothetical protein
VDLAELLSSQTSIEPQDFLSLSAEETEAITPPRPTIVVRRTKSRGNFRRFQSSITLSDESDRPLDDDSEEGSDLDDFVVRDDDGDDGVTPQARSSRPKQALPSLSLPVKAKPFFEPTQFTPTQESVDDDEMPDIGALVGKSGRSTGPPQVEEVRDDRVGLHRSKRRKVIEDDSDE